MRGIHLFVPMLHRYDAVGEHTRTLRDLLVASGASCRIYTDIPDPATRHETKHFLDYESDAAPGDVLVYQFATESAIAGWLATRREPVVINYHSVTPPRYFEAWSNPITRLQVGALEELSRLAPRAALGVAVSTFDADELAQAGCASVVVVPVANVPVPPTEPDPEALRRLRAGRPGGGTRWLSVGRLAPNKAHHQTVAALFVARRNSDPGARLTVVGSSAVSAYAAALRRYVAALELSDAVDFASGLTEGELAARYVDADVLVMLSDHEGFGVPLAEAMSHGLPVVAYDAGAVGEIVGDAGILLRGKGPRQVAEAVSSLMAAPDRRARLVEAGRRRVGELGLAGAGSCLVERLLAVPVPVPAS
ncbi:MAG: glycosyltransferase family 4 protein [Acidimicrobiales bacterium]